MAIHGNKLAYIFMPTVHSVVRLNDNCLSCGIIGHQQDAHLRIVSYAVCDPVIVYLL